MTCADHNPTHQHACCQSSAESLTAEQIIDQGLRQMKEHGFKITNKRKEILSLMVHDQRYLSAQTIHERLAEAHPTMSYNTTYRNLYDFVDIGLLEATEYGNEQMFRINCCQDHHHHHFICIHCGQTRTVDACPMEHIETDLSDVRIESHRFEIFGTCHDCLLLEQAQDH